MKTSDFLIKNLGEGVDTNLKLSSGLAELGILGGERSVLRLVEQDLGKGLIGERAAHDKGRVTGGTSQVDETALSQQNNTSAALHVEAIDLWLNRNGLDGVCLEPGNINFAIEVTNVYQILAKRLCDSYLGTRTANDSIILHDLKVLRGQDICATGGGNKDLTLGCGLFHGGNLVSGDSSLESIDRINLSDDNTSTERTEGVGTALSNITVTGNNSGLSGDHDIGSTLDTIEERFAASVKIIEFRLGNRVVDVD